MILKEHERSMEKDTSSSGSGFPAGEMQFNCSLFSHCTSDELSYSSISCSFVWEVAPPVQKYASYVAAIEAIFFLVSFCFNLIIIANFIRRRTILKEAAGIYLLNVAIIDFMFSIFIILQCLLTESAKNFFIGSTDILRCSICEFLGFMVMFLLSNTLHTLAALSFDRFILFVKPMKYSKYFTWKTAVTIVSFVWVLCICLALPPLFGLGEYGFSTVIANCHPMWTGLSKAGIPNLSYIIFIAIESLIPIILLIITNICMIRIIIKSIGKRRKRWMANESFSQRSLKEINSKIRIESSKKQWQVAKVFGTLFIAHICCWTPVLTVLVTATIIGPASIPLEVYVVSWIFFLTNPVIHPIIETYFIKDIRTSIITAEKQLRHSIFKHTSLLSLQKSNKKRSHSLTKPQCTQHLETNRNTRTNVHSCIGRSTSASCANDDSTPQPSGVNLSVIKKSQLILPIESKETSTNTYEVSITIKVPCKSVHNSSSSHISRNGKIVTSVSLE